MKRHGSTFDPQAGVFDDRAGIDMGAGNDIARAIVEIAAAGPGDVVLEIGAGTGEIGRHLCEIPIRYVGLDLSQPLLAVFRTKLGGDSGSPPLVVADCDRAWPVRGGSVQAIVASRVAHRLNPDHVAQEVMRICRPGGCLLIGRVGRPEESLMNRLRRQRQRLLANRGVGSRPRDARRLIERCIALGAQPIDPQVVARWERTRTAEQIIAAWEAIPDPSGDDTSRPAAVGASGRRASETGFIEIDVEQRNAVLLDLRGWASRQFGDLHRPETASEWYEIGGIRVP